MVYSEQWKGQQLGNYQLIELLGQGHWASVYLGEHLHLHTQAAIKVLQGPWDDSEVESFLSEARTLAHLRHPHIVRVLDFGVQEDTTFLVMEYAPGGTLRQFHPKGTRLPLQTIVSYVKQVASALQYAHAQRLIHRDLKPENLLLGPKQQIWLSDFGLALVAHSAHSQPFQQAAGTLAYMAPEQLEGHPTPASDQYALGVLVYEWLAGERPFSGPLAELAVKQALAPPPALSEKVPTIPTDVEQVVLQALAKDPQLRFASVEAFAHALEEACSEDASRQTLMDLASGDPTEAERRAAYSPHLPRGTVTLLFTDMEDSTKLLQQMGERYTQILGDYRHLLRVVFRQYQGHELDTQGDAFLVAFARATDAISAAAAAQRALARHTWPGGVTVRVCMGLHTGEPELTPEGYVGLDVQHVARIMSAAHGGQILLSATTRELVEHELPAGVSLRDLGEHRLKDLQRPTHLFQLVIVELPADFPPLKNLDRHPHDLSIQPTPLIGREQEMQALHTLLLRPDVRLLTLTGTPGVGKTRLALEVAGELVNDFADGVYVVSLAPLSDPALVIATTARCLGLIESGSQPVLDLLKTSQNDKHRLLVLDNFEHVIPAATLFAELLEACPHLKLLVTSREVLRLRGEHQFAVLPLALPDPRHLPDDQSLAHIPAVKLFLQRAQAIQSDFQFTTDNAVTIAAICLRLEGLPLAIELAAARIKLLAPQALLARLDRRLQVLTGGARDLPLRQRTLRNTLAWSYELLTEEEQRLFQRISAFTGGAALGAIEAVCEAIGDETGRAFDGVASLLDKSLVQQHIQGDKEPRLLMLETVREFGLESLQASGELEQVRQAHAHHYLALAEEANGYLFGAQAVGWFERLEWEYENLRAALHWALQRETEEVGSGIEIAVRLGSALWRFWSVRGHLSEGRTLLERLLAASEKHGASAREKALLALGTLLWHLGDYTRIGEIVDEELSLCRQLGDQRGIAHTLIGFAGALAQQGDYQRARSLAEESLTICRANGDIWRAASSLLILGRLASAQGGHVRAQQLMEESRVLYRELGYSGDMAWPLVYLARNSMARGEHRQASPWLEEAQALFREAGNKMGFAHTLSLLGEEALEEGDVGKAYDLLTECHLLNQEMGNRRNIAHSLFLLARVIAQQGDYVRASMLYEQSLALARTLRHRRLIASCVDGLSSVVATQEQPNRAEALGEAVELPPAPSIRRHDLSNPAGLTAREVEVLRLVAQGLTNEQVAEQLVISPRTVNTHLTSIFNKIGVSSRGAATRYAIEHHLA